MPDNDNNGAPNNNQAATPADMKQASISSELPQPLRHQFETLFKTDLSQVRVHQGHAPTLLGAESFARGNDVYFSPGTYQPHTEQGRELLGHELAHVVQQRQGVQK